MLRSGADLVVEIVLGMIESCVHAFVLLRVSDWLDDDDDIDDDV